MFELLSLEYYFLPVGGLLLKSSITRENTPKV